jgi:hypothetical protein
MLCPLRNDPDLSCVNIRVYPHDDARLCLAPGLWRTDHAKAIAERMRTDANPEMQLRPMSSSNPHGGIHKGYRGHADAGAAGAEGHGATVDAQKWTGAGERTSLHQVGATSQMIPITILCPITSRGCPPEVSEQPLLKALLPSMTSLEMWQDARLVLGYDADDALWTRPEARGEIRHPVEWMELRQRTSFDLTGDLERTGGGRRRRSRYFIPANDDLAFQTDRPWSADRVASKQRVTISESSAFTTTLSPASQRSSSPRRLHLDIFGSALPAAVARCTSGLMDCRRVPPVGTHLQIDQRTSSAITTSARRHGLSTVRLKATRAKLRRAGSESIAGLCLTLRTIRNCRRRGATTFWKRLRW